MITTENLNIDIDKGIGDEHNHHFIKERTRREIIGV